MDRVTTVVAILMVGVTAIGVNLSVINAMGEANDARFAQIDARFEQVDSRFERIDRRLDQMEERIESLERWVDDRFREMAVETHEDCFEANRYLNMGCVKALKKEALRKAA